MPSAHHLASCVLILGQRPSAQVTPAGILPRRPVEEGPAQALGGPLRRLTSQLWDAAFWSAKQARGPSVHLAPGDTPAEGASGGQTLLTPHWAGPGLAAGNTHTSLVSSLPVKPQAWLTMRHQAGEGGQGTRHQGFLLAEPLQLAYSGVNARTTDSWPSNGTGAKNTQEGGAALGSAVALSHSCF